MNVVKVQIADLVFDPNNARKHSTKNLDAIKGSLTKFGKQKPIVVNAKNLIIAGNGTAAAAKELGWKEINAVVSELDDFMQSAFALADNRTAELAEWDLGVLQESLAALEMGDFNIADIGFSDGDFKFDEEDDSIKAPDPELEMTDELKPSDCYLVVMFENKESFKAACERFGVARVNLNISPTENAKFWRTGLGRAVRFENLKL